MNSRSPLRPLNISIVTLLLALLFSNCEKEEIHPREYPRLNTLEVSHISSAGARFNAELSYRGDFNIIRYGFIWAKYTNPNLTVSDRVIYSTSPNENTFSAEIPTTLEAGREYYVNSFVETSDYLVYGNEISFKSLGSQAPLISAFSPLTASWGDTLEIRGKHFSFVPASNKIFLGELAMEVLTASDSLLSAVIPSEENETSVQLVVEIAGNRAVAKDMFTYQTPSF